MLEPRQADIPSWFLVLLVLPCVAYILLGKWSEATKKRERISLLAQVAAEEAFKAETMATADTISLMAFSKNGLQACARCFAPSTTRCSKCKSVRYCSGKCQIIHWRKIHKQECLQLENTCSSSSPKTLLIEKSISEGTLLKEGTKTQFLGYNINKGDRAPKYETASSSINIGDSVAGNYPAVGTSQIPILERRNMDKQVSRKSHSKLLRREDKDVMDSHEEASGSNTIPSNSSFILSKEAMTRHKSRNGDYAVSEVETPRNHNVSCSTGNILGQAVSTTTRGSNKYTSQNWAVVEPRNSCRPSRSSYEIEMESYQFGGDLHKWKNTTNVNTVHNCSSEITANSESMKARRGSHSPQQKIPKLPKSAIQVSGEQFPSWIERRKQISNESCQGEVTRISDVVASQEGNGVSKVGIMKIVGLRKSIKLTKEDAPVIHAKRNKKSKMLFPYDEFVEVFQGEIFDLSPRGLLNCGNSCYANAVLQCLTCTKPLIIYLLRGSHSRACCRRGWCLMCELEQHVMMLTESGGPLSPSRILLHIRSINCQIGDGSQEDAHEFLRLLIASMQSICLEGLGGENKVDPILQETTFIQHVFGGRLKSKVKCMICHHESERFENIMDLTLEIFGWVESLEDALTQFTTAEDLDGENMYRCARCVTYVRAKKQLSIHEAPNILTIVLKRFQEGRYGKINKWITFPDMLDMIPFMTGNGDIPPLYMLYAVVVHMDSLNASFSGHYVSYVKDVNGNWFKIDDTEVQPVPLSQVMSEGAYILFYTRSWPRPQGSYPDKAFQQLIPESTRTFISKGENLSSSTQSTPSSQFAGLEPSADPIPYHASSSANGTPNVIVRSASRNVLPTMEAYARPIPVDFSDATSSDWSLFTSSDEASFTTESTSDSFSAVDTADACNIDTVSSIFNTLCAPEHSSYSTSCRKFSTIRPHARFLSGQEDHSLAAGVPSQLLDKLQVKQLSEFSADSKCSTIAKYASSSIHGLDRTSVHYKL